MRVRNAQFTDAEAATIKRAGVIACEVLADFPPAFLGAVVLVVVILAIGALTTFPLALAYGGAILASWIGVFVCRAFLTKRHWIVVMMPDVLLIRVFRSIFRRAATDLHVIERGVLEFDLSEIESISSGEVDIIWSSIRHQAVNYLLVRPTPQALETGCLVATLDSFQGDRCGDSVQRLAMFRHPEVMVRWTGCRPSLDMFLGQVSAKAFNVPIGPPRSISVDLTNLILMPEEQRNELLLFVKRMGYSEACAVMLSMRLRMSRIEAATFMEKL